MTHSAAYLRARPSDDGHGLHGDGIESLWQSPSRASTTDIGLWVFIGVATSLFFLFLLANALRMNGTDWVTISLPKQLWFSTALLVAGSLLMSRAGRVARAGHPDSRPRLSRLWIAAGACALAFLAVQLWAWQALSTQQVLLSRNPAASFFYLLTAMHGLHVAGGLAAWVVVDRQLRHGDPARNAWRVALCARYWHFLLAVWIAVFASIGWLSPEFVRYLCGTA